MSMVCRPPWASGAAAIAPLAFIKRLTIYREKTHEAKLVGAIIPRLEDKMRRLNRAAAAVERGERGPACGVSYAFPTQRVLPGTCLMAYDPDKHQRHSICLPRYDYAQRSAYFMSVVTQGRLCLFGEVVDDDMRCNDAGRMVQAWWLALGGKFITMIPGAYVVMPNHFHGVVIIDEAPSDRAPEGSRHLPRETFNFHL